MEIIIIVGSYYVTNVFDLWSCTGAILNTRGVKLQSVIITILQILFETML